MARAVAPDGKRKVRIFARSKRAAFVARSATGVGKPDVWAQTHSESIRTFRAHEKQQRAEARRFNRAERCSSRATKQ